MDDAFKKGFEKTAVANLLGRTVGKGAKALAPAAKATSIAGSKARSAAKKGIKETGKAISGVGAKAKGAKYQAGQNFKLGLKGKKGMNLDEATRRAQLKSRLKANRGKKRVKPNLPKDIPTTKRKSKAAEEVTKFLGKNKMPVAGAVGGTIGVGAGLATVSNKKKEQQSPMRRRYYERRRQY